MLAGGALNQENEQNAEMANVCFGSRKLPNELLRCNSPLRVGSGLIRWNAANDRFQTRKQTFTRQGNQAVEIAANRSHSPPCKIEAKSNPPKRVTDVRLLKAAMLLFAASSQVFRVPSQTTRLQVGPEPSTAKNATANHCHRLGVGHSPGNHLAGQR